MKISIIATALLLFASVIYAQTYMGIKAGGHNSLMRTKPGLYTNEMTPVWSYTIATAMKTNMQDNWDFTVNMDYTNYSNDVRSWAGGASHSRNYNYDVDLGYLTLGLMPGYSLGENRWMFLSAGPYLSALINSQIDGTFTGSGPSTIQIDETLSGSARKYFKNFSTGLMANAGFRFKIADGLYVLPQARYVLGLSDIGDDYLENYDILVAINSLGVLLEVEYKLKDFNLFNNN